MDPMTNPRMQERRARMEQMRQSRQSMLRWRWVMVALGGLLAAALLANGSVVIGGILAVMVVMRIVMITRVQRMWREREAALGGRVPSNGATNGATNGAPNGATTVGPNAGPIDV